MIYGVTDQPRLPRAGHIRGGYVGRTCPECGTKRIDAELAECSACSKPIPEPTPRECYPVELPYFTADTRLCGALQEAYPDLPGMAEGRPTELEIVFPTDDLEWIFPHSYRAYSRTGLECMGDGRDLLPIHGHEPAEDGRHIEIGARRYTVSTCLGDERHSATGEACPVYAAGDCRMIGSLRFYMPRLRGLGFLQLDTSSIHGIMHIHGALVAAMQAAGSIRWRPFRLVRRMTSITTPDGRGGRRRADKPLIYLESQQSLADMIASEAPAIAASTPEIAAPDVDLDERPRELYPALLEDGEDGDVEETASATTPSDEKDLYSRYFGATPAGRSCFQAVLRATFGAEARLRHLPADQRAYLRGLVEEAIATSMSPEDLLRTLSDEREG